MLRLSQKFHGTHQNTSFSSGGKILQHARGKGESFKATEAATSPTPPGIRKYMEGKKPFVENNLGEGTRQELSPFKTDLNVTSQTSTGGHTHGHM